MELAEAEAGRAADLLAPAVAVAFKTEAELAQIAAGDLAEAVKVRDRFRDAATAARALFEILEAADMRFLAAIAAGQVRVDTRPTLAEAGINKHLADRARKLAASRPSW